MAVFINEFHYDNAGGDVGEFIEVAGTAGTNLTGWSIELYNGNGGTVYGTIQLSDAIADQENGLGTVAVPRAGIQNGSPDGFALVDPDGTVVQFLSYEGTLVASAGSALGQTSVDIGVAETSSTPAGSSLSLVGTGSSASDFTWVLTDDDTPGAVNGGQTFTASDVPTLTVAIADDAISENGGTSTARVTRSGSTVGELVVALSSSDVSEATVPASVTILDGATFATVTVTAVDDGESDGAQTVTIEATAEGFNAGSDTVEVTDDEPVQPTLISAIQGAGAESALVGEVVTVEAVVVGDFQDGDDDPRDLNGFFLQEQTADEDGDVATSEGIFVFDGAGDVDVNAGDVVRVTGVVEERFGQTQLADVTAVEIISTGGDADALVTRAQLDLSDADDADLEAAEGMLVQFDGSLVITEQFNLDRFGEVRLFDGDDYPNGDRPLQFTQINAPDAAAFADYNAAIDADSIVYDDGRTAQNQPIGDLDGFGPTYTTANAPRMGDAIPNLSGVLGFGFGEYRVHATQDGENQVAALNPRPLSPADVGGDLTVATLNVLNFFTTLDEGGNNGAGPNGLDPRGADNEAEFDRQLEKLVEAIAEIDADVLGLVELENDFLDGGVNPAAQAGQEDVAIQVLVDAVNAALGTDRYDWVRPGQEFVGGDAIAVGYIYDTATVGLQGDTIVLDDPAFLDPNGDGQGRNRAALVQTFEDLASDDVFTLAINHFKSKGGSGTGPDADAGDGQGNFNDARADAARFLVDFLATNPTGADDGDVLILGDLNAYAMEDPIVAIENGADDTAGTADDFTDLAAQFIGDDAYSFVFDGRIGTLDYALANDAMLAQVTGVTEWHINADEADAIDYNLDFGRSPDYFDGNSPARNSDHDPLLVGLAFEANVETSFNAVRTGRFNTFEAALAAVEDEGTIRVQDDEAIGDVGRVVVAVDGLGVIADRPFDADFVLENDGRLSVTGTTNASAIGTDGADLISMSDGDNAIAGLGGDDVIRGFAGDDFISGGEGADVIYGGTGFDTLSFASAAEGVGAALRGPGTNRGEALGDRYLSLENLVGSAFDDTLRGGDVRNVIRAGDGDDVVFGFGGRDLLFGEAGDDTFDAGAVGTYFGASATTGSDFMNGGAGFDTVSYTSASEGISLDFLSPAANRGAAAGDRIVLIENADGTAFGDVISGGNVANVLFGDAGDDTLLGRGGDDTLIGGLGGDTLGGGAGADTFVYRNVDESSGDAADRITDFETGSDVIDLSAVDADETVARNQAFTFIGTDAFTGTAAELRLDGGTLLGDVTGDGVADIEITITGAIAEGDIVL